MPGFSRGEDVNRVPDYSRGLAGLAQLLAQRSLGDEAVASD
jgi:hypothetical protein